MFRKLFEIESKFEQIEQCFSMPEITADTVRFSEMMQEHNRLLPIVTKYREYRFAEKREKEALELLDMGDKELAELASEELAEAKCALETCTRELQILLLPRDPNDEKNVIVEIRGGAGGEESALFA